MTTFFQNSNNRYLVLPGNSGILLASDNIMSKNRDPREENRIQDLVNNSLAQAALTSDISERNAPKPVYLVNNPNGNPVYDANGQLIRYLSFVDDGSHNLLGDIFPDGCGYTMTFP